GPVPSVLPDIPADPAMVVTAPLATITRRIVLFPASATSRFPSPSVARTVGDEKRAAAPVPSVAPDTPADPATVVTAPVATTTFRMMWFRESATNRLPEPSLARPCG